MSSTVDEFFTKFQDPARSTLNQLRDIVDRAAPDAHIALKWGSSAWILASGTIRFIVGGFKQHVNIVFTPSIRKVFDVEPVPVQTGKGSVQLPSARTIDHQRIERMIAYRNREHEQDGVLWR